MLVAKYGDGESSTFKNKRNHCEFIYNNSLSPIAVFGWRNVNVNYPEGTHWYDVDGGKIFDSNIGLVYSYVLRKED